MANNDPRKISGYGACTAPEANALLVITGNTAGTKTTYNLTTAVLLGNNKTDVIVSNTKVLSANSFIVRKKATPVTSTDAIGEGSIWWDSGYIYVAVANNVIKRAALSTF